MEIFLILKGSGEGGGQFDPFCGFLKNVSNKEIVNYCCFFVAFNLIMNNIFPENFIKISQVVQKI